jgi:NTE family protein
MPEPRTPRRGVVFGCGGTLGFAWSAVAAAEVERALGWDLRDAEVLVGTSAGSEMVAALGSGRTPTQVLAALDGEPGADVRTGERVAFGSPGAPRATLGEAIAASWGIPGWFPPVRIDGRRWIDGGAVSTGSADLLAPLQLDEVLVIAPMTTEGGLPARGLDRAERLLRNAMTPVLDREVALLQAQGTRVIRIEPGASELAAMGPNFMDLRRRPATLAAARAALPATIERALA